MWGTGKINEQAPVAGAEFARTRVEGCEAGEVTDILGDTLQVKKDSYFRVRWEGFE